MYDHNVRQVAFNDDIRLFQVGPLSPDNRWVKLVRIVPWGLAEDEYCKNFKSNRGEKAYSARMALGCLIIQEILQTSDRDTVECIKEQAYLQYFVGYPDFQSGRAMDPSLLTHFRKRFPEDILARVNAYIVKTHSCSLSGFVEEGADSEQDIGKEAEQGEDAFEEDTKEQEDEPDESPAENDPAEISLTDSDKAGTLILDATCAPQDIQYPTDVRLLNEARRKLEVMMDTLQKGRIKPKPRNYRKKAKKKYNRFSRNRHPSKKVIRKALREQIQYVARDLRLVKEMQQDSTAELSKKERCYLETIRNLYEQQKTMYETKKHSCPNRIVSIHQPYVCPIVRGKATAGTEFGAKITVTVVDGLAEVNKLSWEAYNESEDLIPSIEQYKEKYGRYPERVLADKIFRTRANRQYCKERGIRLNGPPLGRPPKDKTLYNEQLKIEREESGERNAIEGKFGEGKRRYSLGLIKTKLQETSETKIQLVFLVMNLKKILRDLFASIFFVWFFQKRRQFSPPTA